MKAAFPGDNLALTAGAWHSEQGKKITVRPTPVMSLRFQKINNQSTFKD
jgi:hypothetical protein